jgi:hypothetical protein
MTVGTMRVGTLHLIPDKTVYFSYNYFVTGEDDKAVFSISGGTVLAPLFFIKVCSSKSS